MNGNFVGAIVYVDDITLMGPTRSSIMSLLNECDVYTRKTILCLILLKLTVLFP